MKLDDLQVQGGPAFPTHRMEWDFGSDSLELATKHPGMTLRDYFAAKAMVRAMAVSPSRWWNEGLTASKSTPDIDQCARVAYAMADAMLKARLE